ncbi:MAG: DUF374 domain-containing protein [Ignavibacteria bacterium]|jgi:lysophospholipid acyltransferase (LPLAT)-like uncharacterized protein|nr:DUF374 domain-containing protein [Ignavibacteria bacterium]
MKLIYRFGILLVRIISTTWRICITGDVPTSPAVIAFWHGEMLPTWKIFAHKNSYAVVSQHKDGEFLAYLLTKWNYQLIRGSSNRGGSEVLKRLLTIDTPDYIMITPDGPTGPRMQCKAGAFVVAQKNQLPLHFVRSSIRRKKVFWKSWDKFMFPIPFTRIDVQISDAITISGDMDRVAISELIERCNNYFSK